jgi:hypothetical protein
MGEWEWSLLRGPEDNVGCMYVEIAMQSKLTVIGCHLHAMVTLFAVLDSPALCASTRLALLVRQ